MAKPTACPHLHGPRARASKHALFGAYVSALSLSTSPQAKVGGEISSLHGLGRARGRPHMTPRPLAWAVGPLWGA